MSTYNARTLAHKLVQAQNPLETSQIVTEMLYYHGIPVMPLTYEADKPILYTRIKGAAGKEPMLLYGHMDTVHLTQTEVKDGMLHGNGAVDMKGGIAMMLTAICDMKDEAAGDIILVLTSDEEDDSYGMWHVTANHPYVLKDVKYAISEGAGQSLHYKDRHYYLVSLEERQLVNMRVTAYFPTTNYFTHKAEIRALSDLLAILSRDIQCTHKPKSVVLMKDALLGINQFYYTWSDEFVRLEEQSSNITVRLTGMSGCQRELSDDRIVIDLAVGALPGCKVNLLQKLEHLLNYTGFEFRVDILNDTRSYKSPCDTSKLKALEEALRLVDPFCKGVIPCMVPGFTDATSLNRLGIQTYGFLPMLLPAGFDYYGQFHSNNEHVPLDAIEFGANVLKNLIRRGW